MRAIRLLSQGLLFTLLALFSIQVFSASPYDTGNPMLTNLYVSTSGNDNNNGLTQSTALRTIRGAWSKMQSDGLSSTGYKVIFLPGSYSSDLYLDTLRGSFERPVIFTALNGPGTVNFTGNIQFYQVSYIYMNDISISNPGDVFHCESCDHFLLRNMTLRGGNRQAHETIKVNQSQYFYIENSDISQAYENPIDFVAVQYGHILNNKIHDGDDWCMYVKGGSAQFTIEGNEFYNCGTGGFSSGQGTGFEYMVSPWLHYEAYDIKFINNVIHDTWGAGIGVNGGYNILMAHNTMYRVGERSHGIEFVFGSRSCDGDASGCQRNSSLGGWGPTQVGGEVSIGNKNIYFYNNILYNPSGYQSQWQHFAIYSPRTNPAYGNTPRTVYSDSNLQIRGNITWNGPSTLDLGIGDLACGNSNPTCNEAQLRAENEINTLQPQLIDPAAGNFHPLASGNIFSNPGFEIPDFSGGDSPSPPLIPSGNLLNDVFLDRDGNSRNGSFIPGAYGAGGPATPTADISVSVSDSPDPVVAGNVITYTLRVNNSGPSSAENLIVSGNLTGATIHAAASSQANCAINTNGYTCNFGTLAPGSAEITVLGQTSSSGNLDFTANASTSTADSNSANNSDSERSTVSGDSDGDGVLDANDNCPTISNPNQADNDGDRSGDVCDSDDDNDGVADTSDNCPLASNADQADLDTDHLGDVCDTDLDGDSRENGSDNCPRSSNADQADGDVDGVGNVCDNCPTVSNSNQADSNGNGIGDACEVASRDLIAVKWYTQPKQSCTGSGTSLSCTVSGTLSVKNQSSTALSTAVVMRYYLSTDSTLDSSDFLLREKSSGTFRANQTKNIAFSRTLPKGQSGSGKLVIGMVDATNLIAESNENNNRLASAQIGGTPPPSPPPDPSPPPTSSNIIPNVDEAMKQRLQSILAGGARDKTAFAKIGDSITESGSFLVDIGCNAYDLGTYTSLEPVIQYFRNTTFSALSPTWCGGRGNSFNRASTSAEAGWTTNSALANGSCGESNFRCEIKATNAGYAFIMYGTNDLERYNDIDMFKSNLSRIVSESISLGTVPILSSIPPRLDSSTMGSRVASYNQAIQEVGATYQIPVVNFWQALQNIGSSYRYGMDPDGIHPAAYQGGNASIFTTAGLNYGYNVRNLSFIQMMEKMKRIVGDNGAADSNP